ncbi:TIR domain-containing protein [Vibrio parahaemolyticus]|uniref:TIR domain-containing protein n=1 Tax=Vibrio parahaemolyticus TaxID=670 RepID=UPI001A908A79|nr:TIR domain-containing protein [Vibrio parahaemolyticus]EJB8540397.1 TIR domain-containing protein [Vibrio parahaemolyticus]MBO0188139.1 TIR domain-containing protein [Vibrio parahaemolyticus]MBO0220663.1 TIR domain-containing protein [Vibrio parahaemolyticus]MDF4789642.1 TIR domain-containing protein [Vibrio parahaemolyticus]HBC3558252.1 TIR domain-containing protein [Vibrio parahaemolyticus]
MIFQKKIFISYSWDGDDHKEWVRRFSDRLEEIYEIHVTFDQYDLDSRVDKNHFMEKGIFENDFVLAIITDEYKDKANNRQGGVGIESYLATSKYWDEMLKYGQSNILPILKGGEEVPRYLKGKFYLDFRDDSKFEEKIDELLCYINGDSIVKRPTKKTSILKKKPNKNLTRIEDFLKINYKKRNLVFDRKECTDFSSSNKRIKFEFWETKSPRVNHYLFLFDNIIIKNTIIKLCELIKRDHVKVTSLTVIKSGKSDKGYISRIMSDCGVDIDVTELTYDEYIWDYCIDDDAKNDDDIYTIPYFIDQSLVSDNDNLDLGPSFDFLKNKFLEDEQSTASVVIAPGGTGKTTLCSFLVKYFQKDKDVIPVFIQAEEIKKLSGHLVKQRIDNIFDLYEVYSSVCVNQDEDYVFDKITFEVALLTGKIILVIDGLDELTSIFPEGFELESFLKSIDEINKELASSKVLLTSRNDVISDELYNKFNNINKYTLLGFDKVTCKRYLTKRFSAYEEESKERMIKKSLYNINPLIERDSNQRILPFVVDLLSSLVEKSRKNESIDFSLSFDGKNYESNESLTDYLVYSILRREYIRQSLEISIDDVLEIFMELAETRGDSFPKSELESLVGAFYTENANDVTEKLLRNPLIEINESSVCSFKYDFIAEYFISLKIIHYVNSCSKSESFYKLMARHAYGESNVFKDVCDYFDSREVNFNRNASVIISSLKEGLTNEDVFHINDLRFKSISFIVNVLLVINKGRNKKDISDLIFSLFDNGSVISFFSIYGKGRGLDFSNRHVVCSRFIGNTSFLSSKFSNSKFSSCYFDSVYSNKATDIKSEMFDSCRLGDLESVIDRIKSEDESNRDLLEKELRKFFGGFLNGNNFKDQKRSYIKLSDKVKSIDKNFFDELVHQKVLFVKREKSNEKYYAISPSHQDSIYSMYHNNNFDDDLIRNIISYM